MSQSDIEASDGGRGTTEAAKDAGRDVTQEAAGQAQAVAETTRRETSKVVDEARDQARSLAEDARQQLRGQAREQTEHLGHVIDRFGEQVQALTEGRPEDAGVARDYAERVGGQAERMAERIDDLGFDGMMDEAQRFARRRPGVFLLGAATAGFAMSRLARGAQGAQQEAGVQPSRSDQRNGGTTELPAASWDQPGGRR